MTLCGFLSLMACEKPSEEPSQIDFTPRCGADNLQGLIGQDSATLREVALPQNLRVMRPGMSFTQEYRPERLNISVSEDGVIDRVWCS